MGFSRFIWLDLPDAHRHFLPVAATLDVKTVHHHTLTVAQHYQEELGEEETVFVEDCSADWGNVTIPHGPITMGIDGAYVRGWDKKKRHFEVIVGKSMLAFQAAHILDWFQVTMRLTVFYQYAKGLVHHDHKRGEELQHTLERLKWSLWHGNLSKSLGKIDDTELLIDNVEEAYPNSSNSPKPWRSSARMCAAKHGNGMTGNVPYLYQEDGELLWHTVGWMQARDERATPARYWCGAM